MTVYDHNLPLTPTQSLSLEEGASPSNIGVEVPGEIELDK